MRHALPRERIQINGDANNLAPRQHRPQQAFSSGGELAYEELEEDLEALMERQEALPEGGKGTEKAQLPYSTLRAMQLEREDQSQQEAVDKYAKVFPSNWTAHG